MTTFERIAETNDIVKIITKNNEEFIGKIFNKFFVIKENGELDCEIYISQVEHSQIEYGCVGLPISFIQSIEKLSI